MAKRNYGFPGGGGANMQQMMKQAQKMQQAQMQAQQRQQQQDIRLLAGKNMKKCPILIEEIIFNLSWYL